jgi:hypothetical protein
MEPTLNVDLCKSNNLIRHTFNCVCQTSFLGAPLNLPKETTANIEVMNQDAEIDRFPSRGTRLQMYGIHNNGVL